MENLLIIFSAGSEYLPFKKKNERRNLATPTSIILATARRLSGGGAC